MLDIARCRRVVVQPNKLTVDSLFVNLILVSELTNPEQSLNDAELAENAVYQLHRQS